MEGKHIYISRPNFIQTKNKHVIGIIIVSKLNTSTLNKFIKNVTTLFITGKHVYNIYIIDEDILHINMAKLYNIGFMIAKKNNCEYVIFHNENILPDANMLGYYNTYPSDPINLSYNIKDLNLFVFSINMIEFENIGGFLMNTSDYMNKFIDKLKKTNINITAPSSGTFTLIENNSIPLSTKLHSTAIINKISYKNLQYSIVERHVISDNIFYYKIS